MAYKDTSEVIDELVSDAAKQGLKAEQQDPRGIKIEVGDDDDDAPRIVQHGSPAAPDCNLVNGKKMIKMTLQVSFTDKDSGQDSSGVRRVCAKPVQPSGSISLMSYGWKRWKLTDQEKDESRTGSVTHRFSGNVPCDYFNNNTARFQVWAEDDEGNHSIQYIGITVGGATFEECCGNG